MAFAGLLGLVLLHLEPFLAPAAADPVRSRPESVASRLRCVSGGAPLVGLPRPLSTGEFAFATADGSLHTFFADGRMLQSRGLGGVPAGAPEVRDLDQSILVLTKSRSLWAVSPAGRPVFQAPLLAGPESAALSLPEGRVGFLGHDGYFYVMSSWGQPYYRIFVNPHHEALLVATHRQAVWIARRSDLLRIVNASHVRRTTYPAEIRWLGSADSPGTAGSEGPLLVLSGTQLFHEKGTEKVLLDEGVQLAASGPGAFAWIRLRGASYELAWQPVGGEPISHDLVLGELPLGLATTRHGAWVFDRSGVLHSLGPEGWESRETGLGRGGPLVATTEAVMLVIDGHQVCAFAHSQLARPARAHSATP